MDNRLRAEAIATKAIRVAGGPKELSRILRARGLPISHQAVQQWKRVPVSRAPVVSEITGIPLNVLRPDVNWGAPADEPREARSA